MNTEKVYRIAMIGCGGMANQYRHKYTLIPGAKLALLIDVNEEVAKNAAEKTGAERWSTDWKDALSPDIDIVDVSTPNHLHELHAVACMEAGKHVLLQKPIAPTLAEARRIVETAKKTGVTAGMYMSLFEDPIYYEIKRIIEGGHLGKIASVTCRGAHRGGLRMAPGTWRGSAEKTGGGCFIQLTVHQLDMAQWLLGEKIVRVAAFSKNRMSPNVGGDDSTVAACEFESGAVGTLESSYITEPNILAVYGTKGYIHVMNEVVTLKMDEGYEGDIIKYSEPGKTHSFRYSYNGYRDDNNKYDQHIAFVKAVMEGRPAPVSLETGLYDLQVVKAVYESAKTKKWVEVAEMQ